METRGLIDEVKRNVNFLLAGSGLRREEGEQPVRRLLYHLLMTLSLHDRLSAEERAEVKKLHKRYKNLFASKVILKERKERLEKKSLPPHPLLKEKGVQRIDKENIYMAAGANADFEERREAFRQECLRLLTKDNKQLVADFFHFYSQPCKHGKMLFERKHYWDTESRLMLWMNTSYNLDNTAAARSRGMALRELRNRRGRSKNVKNVNVMPQDAARCRNALFACRTFAIANGRWRAFRRTKRKKQRTF